MLAPQAPRPLQAAESLKKDGGRGEEKQEMPSQPEQNNSFAAGQCSDRGEEKKRHEIPFEPTS